MNKSIPSKSTTSRNYLCTWNNPREDTKEFLERVYKDAKAQYVGGQLEVGNGGTPHIQFYVNFEDPQRRGRITKCQKEIHCEAVYKDNGASTYCLKEDTRVPGGGPFEFGKKPLQRNSKNDWAIVRQCAKDGKFEQIPDDIYVRYYGNLSKINKDNLIPPERPQIKAIWIHGPSGTGKSYLASEICKGSYYPKQRNQWWDGYTNQTKVVINDIDKYDVSLGGFLKDWADRYPLIAQNKGGAVAANWDTIIVTSQYSIEEIWTDHKTSIPDQATIDALKRRYHIIRVDAEGKVWPTKKDDAGLPKVDLKTAMDFINKI